MAQRRGDKRFGFEPQTVVQLGRVQLLDDPPRKMAKKMARAFPIDKATREDPIHFGRPTEKTARSFGVQRRRFDRATRNSYQIHRAALFVAEDNSSGPAGSTSRHVPSSGSTTAPPTFPQHRVSPVEIADAARFIQAKYAGINDGTMGVAALQTFGRNRRAKQLAAHLARAKELP